MSARLRRLLVDYARIRTEFSRHPHVTVEPAGGDPPELYRVTYRVKGLRLDALLNAPRVVHEHQVQIFLTQEYPRVKPQSRMLTDVWHPNIGGFICIGDHWAAGESLVDIIVQIGDMLQYKTYNPASPLNQEAARWALAHAHRLPIDNIDLYQPEPVILLAPDADQAPAPPAPLVVPEAILEIDLS
jgi:ubiquitin-protein ligase